MKITGYALRGAISEWKLKRDAATQAFNGSLYKFEGDSKDTPDQVAQAIGAAEVALATLQTAQMEYNLKVRLELPGGTISLAEAIKRVGGQGRIEKMWKSASSPKKRSSYLSDLDEIPSREDGRVVAERQITTQQAIERATGAGRLAGKFRAAIAVGNATEVEIDLDPALIE